MGTLIKVRFKLAWGTYVKGQIIEPPAMLRGWLLSNGYVEPVQPARPVSRLPLEPATVPAGGAGVPTELPRRKRQRASYP